MKRRQSGIALITALLVVALASIASAAILSSANIAIRRTQNLQQSEVAWWYATGIEAWVKSILERDAGQDDYDALSDSWAQPIDYLPIDEGAANGEITDLQGRFNLNNLAAPEADDYARQRDIFVRMLGNAGIADEFQARALAAAIRDWVDADSEPTGFDGAEDSEYLGEAPPHRTPNRFMASVSELLAVKGVTKDIYRKMRDLVAALPQYDTAVNVNTAAEPLLRALSVQPGPAMDGFLRERKDKPAETVAAIYNDLRLLGAQDVPQSLVSVSSQFFRLRAEVLVGTGRVALYSFYYRPRPGIPAVYGRSTDVN